MVGLAYNHDMETLADRIRYARKNAGLSQQAVADHFSISRVSVTQWEGERGISPERDKIAPLAVLLNTTTEWLLEGKGDPPAALDGAQVSAGGRNGGVTDLTKRALDTFSTNFIPGRQLVSGDRMPVYSGAAAGDDDGKGHMLVTFDAVDYVKRPAALENVRNGYGIIVVNTSMVPAYRPGDTALVNPNLPPMRDTDCVFYHVPPDGSNEAEALIKQLNGFNDRQWDLEQFNPGREFKVSRADWPVCHRVVGRYNRR